jgi:hypothetical protein
LSRKIQGERFAGRNRKQAVAHGTPAAPARATAHIRSPSVGRKEGSPTSRQRIGQRPKCQTNAREKWLRRGMRCAHDAQYALSYRFALEFWISGRVTAYLSKWIECVNTASSLGTYLRWQDQKKRYGIHGPFTGVLEEDQMNGIPQATYVDWRRSWGLKMHRFAAIARPYPPSTKPNALETDRMVQSRRTGAKL